MPQLKLRAEAEIASARKKRWTVFVVASVVIVLILAIVGVSLYFSEDAKYKRLTIITVDDTSIDMDYFLKRIRLAGSTTTGMLVELRNELLIKIEAPRYIAEVSPEDIDLVLRGIASGESETISEDEFKEWYRQQLNEIDLSDSEYRDYIGTLILRIRLFGYLAERVSTVAEQVHLYIIVVETYEDAEEIRVRWEAGEDFADLAREVSLDEVTGENGGDSGWMPRGVLPSGFDQVVFNLTIDDVSEPQGFLPDPTTSDEIRYCLLMVSEKAEAREIDENSLQVLKSQALENWLSEEGKLHEIDWNYDSEIDAWINFQLAKE